MKVIPVKQGKLNPTCINIYFNTLNQFKRITHTHTKYFRYVTPIQKCPSFYIFAIVSPNSLKLTDESTNLKFPTLIILGMNNFITQV